MNVEMNPVCGSGGVVVEISCAFELFEKLSGNLLPHDSCWNCGFPKEADPPLEGVAGRGPVRSDGGSSL